MQRHGINNGTVAVEEVRLEIAGWQSEFVAQVDSSSFLF